MQKLSQQSTAGGQRTTADWLAEMLIENGRTRNFSSVPALSIARVKDPCHASHF
jgi:hypothetical protein